MLLIVRSALRLKLLACGCAAMLGGCGEPLRQDECVALLEQYVTLLSRSDRPATSDAELLKLQTEARVKAARDPAFKRCSSAVSRRKFECAMSAADVDRFEQCL
ncbi:MAG TPA: hypothetical protein VER33_20600 [Polyangiaceae bacterium]|nr:hypothetical protein [Polyangiaceae bacterium]